MTTLVVLSAGLRNPSSTALLAKQLSDATVAEAGDRGANLTVKNLEIRLLANDIANAMTSGLVSEAMEESFETIRNAAGVIVVTPIYNASMAGLLKSYLDMLPESSLKGAPILMGATGGTARHTLALDYSLRPVLAYLKALVLPTAVFAATEDFGHPGLSARVNRAAAELVALMFGASGRGPGTDSAHDLDLRDELSDAPSAPSPSRQSPDDDWETALNEMTELLHGKQS